MSRLGWLSPARMAARARGLLKEFDVRGGDVRDARRLAVGRQPAEGRDRARAVGATREVLIAAQPTRGLDVGAIEFVHRRLVEERDAGRAVLLVSLELEEVRSLSDRVLVIYEGEIVAELPPDASEEDFGVAMTGGGQRRTSRRRAVSAITRRDPLQVAGAAPTTSCRPRRPSPRGWRATSAPAGSSRR